MIMKGMPWVVSPGPKKIMMVASMKMTVVIANKNMCPGEFNNDPLELEGRGRQRERPNACEKMKNTRLTGVS